MFRLNNDEIEIFHKIFNQKMEGEKRDLSTKNSLEQFVQKYGDKDKNGYIYCEQKPDQKIKPTKPKDPNPKN